jgi:hypothetical protein
LLAVAAGCGFEPSGGGDRDGAPTDVAEGDGARPDATSPDSRPMPDAAAAPLCADPTNLVVCMPFDDGTRTNQVAGGPQLTTDTGVGSTPGQVGLAATFGAQSVAWWDETTALDLQPPFTIEMFVYYTQDPPTNGSSDMQRLGVFDNDSQFSIFLRWHQASGAVDERVTPMCNVMSTAWGAPITKDAWHHVACVHDGTTLTVYTDGIAGIPIGATQVSTTGTNGTTMGQNCDSDPTSASTPLIGRLDELRVWTEARSAVELLTAAQR